MDRHAPYVTTSVPGKALYALSQPYRDRTDGVRNEQREVISRAVRWLKRGGCILVNFVAGPGMEGLVAEHWLDEKGWILWSSLGYDGYTKALEGAGMKIVVRETVEEDDAAAFFWVIAVKRAVIITQARRISFCFSGQSTADSRAIPDHACSHPPSRAAHHTHSRPLCPSGLSAGSSSAPAPLLRTFPLALGRSRPAETPRPAMAHSDASQTQHSPGSSSPPPAKHAAHPAAHDAGFTTYLRAGKYADAMLKVRDTNGKLTAVPIHRVLLSHRSTFFDDLFSQPRPDMHLLTRLPVFTLPVLPAHPSLVQVVGEVLVWAYGGGCVVREGEWDQILGLIRLASAFSLPPLATIATSHLSSLLTNPSPSPAALHRVVTEAIAWDLPHIAHAATARLSLRLLSPNTPADVLATAPALAMASVLPNADPARALPALMQFLSAHNSTGRPVPIHAAESLWSAVQLEFASLADLAAAHAAPVTLGVPTERVVDAAVLLAAADAGQVRGVSGRFVADVLARGAKGSVGGVAIPAVAQYEIVREHVREREAAQRKAGGGGENKDPDSNRTEHTAEDEEDVPLETLWAAVEFARMEVDELEQACREGVVPESLIISTMLSKLRRPHPAIPHSAPSRTETPPNVRPARVPSLETLRPSFRPSRIPSLEAMRTFRPASAGSVATAAEPEGEGGVIPPSPTLRPFVFVDTRARSATPTTGVRARGIGGAGESGGGQARPTSGPGMLSVMAFGTSRPVSAVFSHDVKHVAELQRMLMGGDGAAGEQEGAKLARGGSLVLGSVGGRVWQGGSFEWHNSSGQMTFPTPPPLPTALGTSASWSPNSSRGGSPVLKHPPRGGALVHSTSAPPDSPPHSAGTSTTAVSSAKSVVSQTTVKSSGDDRTSRRTTPTAVDRASWAGLGSGSAKLSRVVSGRTGKNKGSGKGNGGDGEFERDAKKRFGLF
ncbi:hypothetical protein M427DRAFT_65983 [Gonapodya prolifera JEL478]|uniref:BTB domain-containing protein n=1 Tax=Gonapodya prolifera (strain JEL478) TaxID=1344416 RepID=A0A139AWZ0_GONPJ|nr:hypothetical protein M427DRAFT_65983 [Gonapodya prolifera JEL478]|eukprot:KXS21219.1 hypothetical protein M427DRAFT_65983 [Gonapodya prolifera JEL478]